MFSVLAYIECKMDGKIICLAHGIIYRHTCVLHVAKCSVKYNALDCGRYISLHVHAKHWSKFYVLEYSKLGAKFEQRATCFARFLPYAKCDYPSCVSTFLAPWQRFPAAWHVGPSVFTCRDSGFQNTNHRPSSACFSSTTLGQQLVSQNYINSFAGDSIAPGMGWLGQEHYSPAASERKNCQIRRYVASFQFNGPHDSFGCRTILCCDIVCNPEMDWPPVQSIALARLTLVQQVTIGVQEYQVVSRHLPTGSEPTPKIYRMRITRLSPSLASGAF